MGSFEVLGSEEEIEIGDGPFRRLGVNLMAEGASLEHDRGDPMLCEPCQDARLLQVPSDRLPSEEPERLEPLGGEESVGPRETAVHPCERGEDEAFHPMRGRQSE